MTPGQLQYLVTLLLDLAETIFEYREQVWKSDPPLWPLWHLPAADPPHPTAHHHGTAPRAPIGQRAHWAARLILWTPSLSHFLTLWIIPVCLEKRAQGPPAVRPLSARAVDPPMDTVVRELSPFVVVDVFHGLVQRTHALCILHSYISANVKPLTL